MEDQTNEQPLLMLTSRVTHKEYIKFFWRWMLRYRKGYIGLLAFMLVFLVLYITAAVWHKRKYGDSLFSGASLWAFWPTITVLLISRYARQREMYQAETLFAFYEDHVKSRCAVLGTAHYKATFYENFASAIETKSAFYMMLHARKIIRGISNDYYDPDPYGASVILDKEQLSPEQQQALRTLFAVKFGEKFKTKM